MILDGIGTIWGGRGTIWGGIGTDLGWDRNDLGWDRNDFGWDRNDLGWDRNDLGWDGNDLGRDKGHTRLSTGAAATDSTYSNPLMCKNYAGRCLLHITFRQPLSPRTVQQHTGELALTAFNFQECPDKIKASSPSQPLRSRRIQTGCGLGS